MWVSSLLSSCSSKYLQHKLGNLCTCHFSQRQPETTSETLTPFLEDEGNTLTKNIWCFLFLGQSQKIPKVEHKERTSRVEQAVLRSMKKSVAKLLFLTPIPQLSASQTFPSFLGFHTGSWRALLWMPFTQIPLCLSCEISWGHYLIKCLKPGCLDSSSTSNCQLASNWDFG